MPVISAALKRRLPNWMTYSRIALIPVIGALLLMGESQPAALLGVLGLLGYAIVTDWLDGYLARRWSVCSDVGRLLDPIADKLLVSTVLILLACQQHAHPVAVTLIVFRELAISGLREFMQERGEIVHVSALAKYKTTSQMLACLLLVSACAFAPVPNLTLGARAALWLAALLSLVTGYAYLHAARKSLLRSEG